CRAAVEIEIAQHESLEVLDRDQVLVARSADRQARDAAAERVAGPDGRLGVELDAGGVAAPGEGDLGNVGSGAEDEQRRQRRRAGIVKDAGTVVDVLAGRNVENASAAE